MPPVGYKAQVAAALPGTVPEVIIRCGLTESTVKRWIRLMREAGECHIGSWKRSTGSGAFQSVHMLGPGKDARCRLKARTGAQYSVKYRENMKKDGRIDLSSARRSARYWADKATQQPHDWASLLFSI